MKKYDWNAKDYKKHSHAQLQWARELVEKLHLKGNKEILDIGCGDGKITAEIAGHVPDGTVIGVDNSLAMIKLARELFSTDEYPNLSFALMDAAALSFTEKFDIVFSNAALHWLKNHEPVLHGIHRALKPGGRILLQMGGKGNAHVMVSFSAKIMEKNRWRDYFVDFDFPYGFFDADEYTVQLKQQGFLVERVELIPKDMVQDGKTGLAGWIRSTWLPYTNRIPEKYRDDFIDDLATAYLDHVPLDENGMAHVAMVRLEVAAVKDI
jgi:trans-aconitate 2-methyltransferase